MKLSSFPFFKFLTLKKKTTSLGALNATQFFGVINDNLFKLLMIFLLIETLGKDKATSILSAAGAVYVIPFLLFSSSAGILADRISKQRLIVILKGVEVLLMLLALFAFFFKIPWACYTLLFLLAAHSAMFGPPKYGIIPELVTKDKVSKANSLITSFTYLAIILGTFLASFLTEVTDKNFVVTAAGCLVVALLGLYFSLKIEKTPPQGSDKKMSPFFVREIYQTMMLCRTIKYLAPSILGSAYFLFIGAFAQLNIIPFAMQQLQLSEIAGGYLFLIISLGIAAGSILCGKYTKKKLELGISCLAGLALSLSFILLSVFSFSLIATTALLILLGLAGGMFIIPFDSFIQINAPIEKRGQVIAATNFLSFLGVLIASVCLYVFGDLLQLSPALSFAVVGTMTLFVSFLLALRLSGMVLPYLARKIFYAKGSFEVNPDDLTVKENSLYILEEATIAKAILFTMLVPDVHFLLPKRRKRPFWYSLVYSLEELEEENNLDDLIQKAKASSKKYVHSCLLLKDCYTPTEEKKRRLSSLFAREEIFHVKMSKKDKEPHKICIKKV